MLANMKIDRANNKPMALEDLQYNVLYAFKDQHYDILYVRVSETLVARFRAGTIETLKKEGFIKDDFNIFILAEPGTKLTLTT